MSKITKKSIIKVAIIVLIVGVVIAGTVVGLSLLKKKNHNKKEVLVVPVSSVSSNASDWGSDDSKYEGRVTTSMSQKVYITSSTKIEEICVSEGQQISAGDLILKYDVTAQQLQLDSKKASVALANNRVTSLERDLKRLKEIVPVEDQPKPEPTPTPTPQPSDDPLATDTDATATTESAATNTTTESSNNSFGENGNTEQTYTREELKKAIANKENEIRDAKVSASLEEIAYEIMLNSNSSPELYSNYDGVVSSVLDETTAITENKPLIVITNSEGLTIEAYVGEYDLATVGIGDEMQLYCYDTGMYYYGKISDIGVVPSEESSSWGVVQSKYPVEISVPDASDLTQGMYLEVTKSTDENLDYSEGQITDDSLDSGFSYEETVNDDEIFTIGTYLIRKEAGQRYVMKEVDGKLVKTYVKTGKTYWGSEVEILSGLSRSDYIAFPYSSDAVEGVRTRHGSVEELYGY